MIRGSSSDSSISRSLLTVPRLGRDTEALQIRGSDRLPGPQPLQVEVLDDPGVGVGADVDHDIASLLVGVDVVEGEAGLGLERADALSGLAVEEVNRVPRSGFQR